MRERERERGWERVGESKSRTGRAEEDESGRGRQESGREGGRESGRERERQR